MKAARLGNRGAVAIRGDEGVVQVAAPRQVAQWQQQLERKLARLRRDQIGQVARLDKIEVGVGRFMLARARHGVGRVIELARILQCVPVLHHHLRAAYVEQLVLWIPYRTVVKIFRRLQVERPFLIAGRWLVTTNALGDMVKGMAKWLDADGA